MATLNELRDWFQKSYQEQIEAPEDQIMKVCVIDSGFPLNGIY